MSFSAGLEMAFTVVGQRIFDDSSSSSAAVSMDEDEKSWFGEVVLLPHILRDGDGTEREKGVEK